MALLAYYCYSYYYLISIARYSYSAVITADTILLTSLSLMTVTCLLRYKNPITDRTTFSRSTLFLLINY